MFQSQADCFVQPSGTSVSPLMGREPPNSCSSEFSAVGRWEGIIYVFFIVILFLEVAALKLLLLLNVLVTILNEHALCALVYAAAAEVEDRSIIVNGQL